MSKDHIVAIVDETGAIGFRKPLTPSDLDEIRKRCEAANGPQALPECSVEGCDNGADPRWFISHGGECLPACDGHGGMVAIDLVLRDPLPRWPNKDADRNALAAAVPRLLDEVERLRKIILNIEYEAADRLVLLEPVWEAAKRWSEIDHGADDRDDWCDENCPKRQAEDILYAFVVIARDKEQAIDAAVAKEKP